MNLNELLLRRECDIQISECNFAHPGESNNRHYRENITMNRFTGVTIFLAFFILLTGCGEKRVQYLSDEKMTPTLSGDFFSSGKKLLIRKVSGGKTTFIRPQIGHVDFQNSLIETLEVSGMFKEVVIEGTEKEEKEEVQGAEKKKKEDKYLLNTNIIYGGMQPDKEVMGENAFLFVQYVLFDVNTRKELWRKIIFSEYGAELGKEYVGHERLKMSYEGAVRNNLTDLVVELSEVLSSQKKKK
jgi:hypothetical protein